MARIVWNHKEKSAIFDEMVEILVEEPNAHPRDVLTRCQTVLPVERRRDVTYNMIFNYKTTVTKAEAEANKQRPKRSAAKVEMPPPPSETEALMEQLMKKFATMVVDEIAKRCPTPFYLQHPSNQKPAPAAPQPTVAKVDLPDTPGILVIGLNGHQMSLTRSRFPRKDIMFLHSDDAQSHNPIKRDHTILMTKFISHSIQERYRHAPNLRYCNGGLSELNTILTHIR